ncbi:hypothetical protein R7Z49_27550, partial [Vibrio sp. 1562]|nr:hypothetical protein [Vibrio sp. 1562]
ERITVPRTDKNTINNNNKLTFSMPEPGSNRVLSVSELRWCLREEITLNTYQTELNVNRAYFGDCDRSFRFIPIT